MIESDWVPNQFLFRNLNLVWVSIVSTVTKYFCPTKAEAEQNYVKTAGHNKNHVEKKIAVVEVTNTVIEPSYICLSRSFLLFEIADTKILFCMQRIRQWWSILRTHRSQIVQWCVRGGLGEMHFLQMPTASGISCPFEEKHKLKSCWICIWKFITHLRRLSRSSNAGHVEIKDDVNQKPMANNEQDAGNSGTTTPPVGKAKVIGHPYDESHQSTHSSNKKLKSVHNIRVLKDGGSQK